MSRNEKQLTPIPLDWSRLLGFDQAMRKGGEAPATVRDARLTKVGAKPCQIRNFAMVGTKTTVQPGPR